MTPRADIPAVRWPPSFVSFLRDELAPRPGRVAAVTRVAASCAIVTAITMTYEIPLAAMMVYIVFLISQEDSAGTLVTGLVAGVAATLAVALSLTLYTLDASEPALRLPLMAMSAFLGMFLARTLVIGPAAFLAAYVLVLSQTIIDEVSNVEDLTRLILWLWVIVMVPATLTIAVNLALGQNPRTLARRTASDLLRLLVDAIRADDAGELRRHSMQAVRLAAVREHAAVLDHGLHRLGEVDAKLIDTLTEVIALHRILPSDISKRARASLLSLAQGCLDAFEQRDPGVRPQLDLSDNESPVARPVAVAMFAALGRLADGIAERNDPASVPEVSPRPRSVFVADAFTTPAHLRFALKATIGIMLAYVIYSGLDWPGLNTSMTTVFFVSLASLGESVHKSALRIGGCVVGGALSAIALVYVLPRMTDVGQICVVVATVSAACSWVATSDERLSYAGLQIAFAFFLGTLQSYGPSTEFTFFKNRMFGILLGNVVVTVVFSLLWPVSVGQRARSSLASALRSLGALLKRESSQPGTSVALLKAVGEGRRLVALAAFELKMLPAEAAASLALRRESMERLAAAVFVVVEQDGGDTSTSFSIADAGAASWFESASAWLLSGQAGPPPPWSPTDYCTAGGETARSRIAREARDLLRHEIEVASAS